MLAHAATTTSLLVAGSLLSKMMVVREEDFEPSVPHDLLARTTHWQAIADETQDDLLKLQHYVTAYTFLQAAQSLASDTSLEQATGLDVSRLARSLRHRVRDTKRGIKYQTTPPVA